MVKIFLFISLIMLAVSIFANVNEFFIGNFSQQSLSGWEEKSFYGHTMYQFQTEEDNSYLIANANASASALFKKVSVDLNKTPFLNWSWRLEKPLDRLNEQTKQGDDYAARVYVILKRGLAPWRVNALNYVWSSDSKPAMSWSNAFTDKAIMIPLRNQHDKNTWHHEKVNIKQDFSQYFDLDVEHIHAIAIMTDTDNSQMHAIASYGDIYFTAN